ncbi:hypothetical protein [Pseudoxanthomonas sp. CF125]|uniref:hypothetical protein n=1 Tax=Pseudoxanthomonas sp. CF125 TaxID=1855303 RepID=UPI00088FD2B1|nr:hypothetical protein [Pseudoxanthomonas sp. CF125]SDR06516.1 hypothetical protein SAMN05216569_2900 [Pseudoxanthomonas sp. CF125]
MKTLSDDPEYRVAVDTMNELNAKKLEVDRQILEIEAGFGKVPEENPDKVAEALGLKPGCVDAVPNDGARLQTLRQQSQQLSAAINLQWDKAWTARRYAGYRLFAQNAGNHQKLTARLVAMADSLIELNKELQTETKRLYALGCDDAPAIQFPSFGLTERLPYWRDELEDQRRNVDKLVKAYANDKK